MSRLAMFAARAGRGMRPSPRRDEGGTSLLEMVVVVAILMTVVAVAMAGLVSAQNANQGNTDRVGNLDQARELMQYSTKDLRTAVRLTSASSPFVNAAPRDVVFTAAFYNTSVPVEIHLWVNTSNQLLEDIVTPTGSAPNWSYDLTKGVTRFVGRFISNTPSQPIFTYIDNTATPVIGGSPLVPTTTTCFSGSALCLSPAQLLTVHSVVIDFFVRATSVFAPNATELTNRVSLPNLDYNPNGSYYS